MHNVGVSIAPETDRNYFQERTEYGDTQRGSSGLFLGNPNTADFLRHFEVERDTHVKITTCLDPNNNDTGILDTSIGLYRVRDEDDRLVFIAENDDCELCAVRNASVGRPTQSLLDLVLERGNYLLQVEAGETSGDGTFRFAIMFAGTVCMMSTLLLCVVHW